MIRPTLTIIAGPNGSGKSTLTDFGQLQRYGVELPSNYINPDNLARELAGNDRLAWTRARDLRSEYRNRRISFAFETVFSHPSTLIDIIECRKAGYHVRLLYVVTEHPDVNVARVIGRVLQGGHHVDEGKIRERYARSLGLLPRAVEECDASLVFDTSDQSGPSLCFQAAEGVETYDIPDYLQIHLVDILTQRSNERNDLKAQFGILTSADLNHGDYRGAIVAETKHYLVQLVDTSHILHDRLTLADVMSSADRVQYKQAVGTMG